MITESDSKKDEPEEDEPKKAKSPKDEPHAAVAVVRSRDRWLLGLSTSTDRRKGLWCMPGGGIKRGESHKKAAERECWEETGVRVEACGEPFTMSGYSGVVFVPCKSTKTHPSFTPNHEFSGMGWFKLSDMRQLKLFPNVRDLIKRAS